MGQELSGKAGSQGVELDLPHAYAEAESLKYPRLFTLIPLPAPRKHVHPATSRRLKLHEQAQEFIGDWHGAPLARLGALHAPHARVVWSSPEKEILGPELPPELHAARWFPYETKEGYRALRLRK